MSRLVLIHVSDTHFALDHEKLGLPFTRASASFAPLMRQARVWTLKQKGTRAAERRLWNDLLSTLEDTADAFRQSGESVAVVHTGDITQAGQLESLERALRELENAMSAPVHAVIGNHDLWPKDFPAFAATKTAQQFGHLRNVQCMPESSQVPVALGPPHNPTAELYLCCTAVADSLLNSVALGKFEPEEGHIPPPPTPRRLTGPLVGLSQNLLTGMRIAALHHPVIDSGASRWRDLQHQLGWTVGMVLQDANDVQALLDNRGVCLVLCGHEHARAPMNKRLCCDDKLLQLTAGCPTLWKGKGNGDVPQFSVYIIEKNEQRTPWLTLDSYVCKIDPARWEHDATYQHDGRKWSAAATAVNKLPSALHQKPQAPFP